MRLGLKLLHRRQLFRRRKLTYPHDTHVQSPDSICLLPPPPSYPFHPYYYSSLEVHHTIDHQEGDKIDLPYYLTEEVAEDTLEKEETD